MLDWSGAAVNFAAGSGVRHKRGLVELCVAARDNLARLASEGASGVGGSYSAAQSISIEDVGSNSVFRNLEKQLELLDFSSAGLKEGADGFLLDTGLKSDSKSNPLDETDSWNALQERQELILQKVVTQSLEDVLRLTASRLWDEEFKDWEATLSDFEQSLETTELSWAPDPSPAQTTGRAPPPSRPNRAEEDAGPQTKLLLNLINKSPSNRTPDSMRTIAALSADLVPEEFRVGSLRMWETVIRLCGTRPKPASVGGGVLNLLSNSLGLLEDLCRRQISRYTSSLDNPAVVQASARGSFVETLLEFCALEAGAVQFPSCADHVWQLLYWFFRCGSVEGLLDVSRKLRFYTAELNGVEARVVELIVPFLVRKLLRTSQSRESLNDLVEDVLSEKDGGISIARVGRVSNYEEFLAPDPSGAVHELLRAANAQRSELHPIAPLLLALLIAEAPPFALKESMPNATAEDFVWYSLHVAALKTEPSMIRHLANLQRKILKAGAQHFSSNNSDTNDRTEDLSFARIATLALAPSAALDWVGSTYKCMGMTTLLWTTYLSQYNMLGREQSVSATFFPSLDNFLGSTSLGSAFTQILADSNDCLALHQPQLALQICELLPPASRESVAASVIHKLSPLLWSDEALEQSIIGTIAEDGACRGALLFRVLCAPSWEKGNAEAIVNEARIVFEKILAVASEHAASAKHLAPAIRWCYFISRDRACFNLLLRACADSTLFPTFKRQLPTEVEAAQRSIISLVDVYKKRYEAGELADLDVNFQLLSTSFRIAMIYRDTCHCAAMADPHLTTLRNIIDHGFLPGVDLIRQWSKSELALQSPRLIELCAECLSSPTARVEDVRAIALQVLEGARDLISSSSARVSSEAVATLKSLSQ